MPQTTQHNSLKLRFASFIMTKGMNFWPPFLAAGIRVKSSNKDMTEVTVQLKQTVFNTNIVGVHFGGSIYAMCDPFYMGILLHHLGAGYTVWDKGATIRFLKPGRGIITAVFKIPPAEILAIKERADTHGKTEEHFTAQVKDISGQVIAEVDKIVWVRNKSMKRPSSHQNQK